MSGVKRYDAVHIRYEENNIRYGEGCEVEMVTAADYDRDTQELRGELNACKSPPGGCGYWREAARLREAERDELRAQVEAMRAIDAHAVAEKVREALDRKACPDAWMVIAYEAAVAALQANQ